MDKESLKASIETYKNQLQQIEQTIQAAGETDDLVALRRDLQELISLTEESLLSLMKSELLQSLDEAHGSESEQPVQQENGGKSADTALDNEYAAFQELLGDDVTQGEQLQQSHDRGNSPTRAENSNATELSDMYQEIVGTKCRAPYTHEWGSMGYHNALIVGIDQLTDQDLPKVRVMFCNPTHCSMLPCKYYLEDKCRFLDQECRNSHGSPVDLEDLKEFEDPDYSCLKVESKCLARYDEDDIWYKATVVEIGQNHDMTVTFDSYDDECVTVPLEDILPIEHEAQSSDDSDEDINNQPISREESDDEDTLPVYLWKPQSHGLGDLGQWEAHTRGIGSKLMTKMGYEPGKGLGKDGVGRVEPVPIQLLPQGKSLDKIMKLKEISGDRDMFDALKKQEKKMKKDNEKREKNYIRAEKPNVFDFINKKLGGKKGIGDAVRCYHCGGGLQNWEPGDDPPFEHAKWYPHCPHIILVKGQPFIDKVKGNCIEQDCPKVAEESEAVEDVMETPAALSCIELGYKRSLVQRAIKKYMEDKRKLSQLVHHHEGQGHKSRSQGRGHRHISEHELKDKSDRHLNIQLLKTNEEMKNVEKELVKLKQSLARNENRDKKMADQIRDKIKSNESYLQRLKTSEKAMENHQMKRSHHKKLTVF